MEFTFGIVTGGSNDNNINKIIDSIENQNIENYEVIIVGASSIDRDNITVIDFNESIKSMWITKKKNIITQNAKYENVVYMHDYIMLTDGWYDGFLKYGNDFKTCMTKMINPNGQRYRDWTLWAFDVKELGVAEHEYLLPYDELDFSQVMYYSGAYWVAKKEVMEEFPLNENRIWGQGEDVEWSERIRKKYKFSMNPNSTVELLKHKDPIFRLVSDSDLNMLRSKLNI